MKPKISIGWFAIGVGLGAAFGAAGVLAMGPAVAFGAAGGVIAGMIFGRSPRCG